MSGNCSPLLSFKRADRCSAALSEAAQYQKHQFTGRVPAGSEPTPKIGAGILKASWHIDISPPDNPLMDVTFCASKALKVHLPASGWLKR